MAEKTLIANVQRDEKDAGTFLVTSPIVAMADGAPKAGVFLNPFDRVITMKILNERYVLRLPRDIHGRVSEVFIPNSFTPVAYGEPIARLDPRALNSDAAGLTGSVGRTGESSKTEDTGLITIDAPSDGIFYRRSSPDSPPYVEVGSPVVSGTTLGLVEIMKCFHQITYGGTGLPEKGKVVKILAEDAAEVRFSQPLFHVKPAE
jgi:acetyl-CoA carboxylase biotin carboxyl carrier protein